MAFGQETLFNHFEKRVGVNRSAKSVSTYCCVCGHVYLCIKRELAPNTIMLYMLRLHTVINKAIAAGIITDPFAGYEPPCPERKRRYLTREELQRLITTPLPSSRLYLVCDLFLFSCYTGISYGDMCRLTAANLETAEDGTV